MCMGVCVRVLDQLSWGCCYLAARRHQQREPDHPLPEGGSGRGLLGPPEKGFPDPVSALKSDGGQLSVPAICRNVGW